LVTKEIKKWLLHQEAKINPNKIEGKH